MRFTQIIDFETERIDEMRALMDEMQAREERHGYSPTRAVILKDRDNANRYYAIVDFPSHEDAMRNSDDPQTADHAARLQELCTRPMRYVNCDVLEVREP